MEKTENGCIDFVYSPDDGGWYGQEYDFTRNDSATRTTKRIYSSRTALMSAVSSGKPNVWEKWK